MLNMWEPNKPLPQIRPVEAFPINHEGQPMIGMRDPTGISPHVLIFAKPTLLILQTLDGKSTPRDVQALFMRQFKELIPLEKICEVVDNLDKHLFLESDHFRETYDKIVSDFKEAPVRKSRHSGSAYPGKREELEEVIDQFFIDEAGPGKPEIPKNRSAVHGLAAPHIDYGRGWIGYAHAYKKLAEREVPDIFIILGTCHQMMPTPYAMTKKKFETPLGECEVDTAITEKIEKQTTYNVYKDEFFHRNEHSIEFQIVMLQHLYKKSPLIVPVLCGGFYGDQVVGSSPMENPQIKSFITALENTINESEKSVCVIASVDLAHIGAQFGDDYMVDENILKDLEKQDLAMLDLSIKGDCEGFWNNIVSDNNGRKICGTAPLYTLTYLMKGKTGVLLHYDQAFSPENTVSYASMIW